MRNGKKERRKKEIRFDFGKYESELRISTKRLIASSFSHPQLLSADCAYPFAIDFACMSGKRVGEEEEKHIKIRKITFYISCESSSFPHSCVRQQDGTKAEALNVAMCGCECVSLDFLILNALWNLLPFSCWLFASLNQQARLESSSPFVLAWHEIPSVDFSSFYACHTEAVVVGSNFKVLRHLKSWKQWKISLKMSRDEEKLSTQATAERQPKKFSFPRKEDFCVFFSTPHRRSRQLNEVNKYQNCLSLNIYCLSPSVVVSLVDIATTARQYIEFRHIICTAGCWLKEEREWQKKLHFPTFFRCALPAFNFIKVSSFGLMRHDGQRFCSEITRVLRFALLTPLAVCRMRRAFRPL